MRKRMVFLLLLLLVPLAASADTVGLTGRGEAIHRWEAPNGQALYYLTAYEELEEVVRLEDVSFDGVEDVVVMTGQGANNVINEFFVWDGTQYVLARHNGDTAGLWNYRLIPETGLVVSDANNGLAGAQRQTEVFRWEGTQLCRVRSAASDYVSETVWEGNRAVTTVDYDTMRVTVQDAAGNVLWMQDVSVAELDEGVLGQWDAALWDGLLP